MKNLFKKTVISLFAIVAFYGANAQTSIPQLVNFQAVARDDNNNPVVSQLIQIKIKVLQGGPTGTVVYGAEYIDSTNLYGEFSRRIGTTPSYAIPGVNYDFSLIPWQTGNMWVSIEYKPTIGSGYKTIGVFQYLSTPYAFSAKTAEKLVVPATTGQVLTFDGSDWKAGVNPGVPIGTIIAYAGSTVPSGWALCDGASQSINGNYAPLYAAIGDKWGTGGAGSFNLPDLRGMFLRGWDGNANNDPDKNSRTANRTGGATGNNVGSVQADAFQGHQHQYLERGGSGGSNWSMGSSNSKISPVVATENIVTDGNNGTPKVSSETRPKNAYVMYIIKYQ